MTTGSIVTLLCTLSLSVVIIYLLQRIRKTDNIVADLRRLQRQTLGVVDVQRITNNLLEKHEATVARKKTSEEANQIQEVRRPSDKEAQNAIPGEEATISESLRKVREQRCQEEKEMYDSGNTDGKSVVDSTS